jgi:hypothetical protein
LPARAGLVATWFRSRETAEHGGTLWLALVLGVAFLIPFAQTSLHLVTSIFILGGTLALSIRWRMGYLVVLVLVGLGIWLRYPNQFVGGYSDVLTVTRLAIERMLTGQSPYGVGYEGSLPPGSPFPYGPLTLLWYLPFRDDPKRVELYVSVVVLLLLAARGGPLGLVLYALSPLLIALTADGSNDTSAGLFLLFAVIAIPRAPWLGGLLLGLAAGFKLHNAAWLPALVFWSGTIGLAGFLVGAALTWGTATVVFGPGSMMEGVRLTAAIVQSRSFWSLAWLIEWWSATSMPPTLFNGLRIVLGAVSAVVTGRRVRSGRDVAAAGTWVFLVTLYTGYWSSFSYLGAVAPVVCWHLDDWIGLGDRRVRWPWPAWLSEADEAAAAATVVR